MSLFKCPKCHEALVLADKHYQCCKGHTYDCARSGYVNLLMSQQSKEKRHGDDKEMVRSRRAFLERGYYRPLLEKILEVFRDYHCSTMLDIGCGTCWYTEHLLMMTPHVYGVDISKEAVDVGARAHKDLYLAVGSSSELPVLDASFDGCLNVFAPYSDEELNRVMTNGGVFIRVYPLARHLIELKEIAYDRVYLNPENNVILEGFNCVAHYTVEDQIQLSRTEDIMNLFSMTPYAHRTPEAGILKLQALKALDVTTSFGLSVYIKEDENGIV